MFPALTCARPSEGLGTRLAIGHVHVSMGTRINHCVRCNGIVWVLVMACMERKRIVYVRKRVSFSAAHRLFRYVAASYRHWIHRHGSLLLSWMHDPLTDPSLEWSGNQTMSKLCHGRGNTCTVLNHTSKKLNDEENQRLYGKCYHPNGHGHNYVGEHILWQGNHLRYRS